MVTVGDIGGIQGRNNNVWIGGDGGLEQSERSRFVPVVPGDGTSFQKIKGIAATTGDSIYFGENRGIIHIAEDECSRVEQNPAYRVKYNRIRRKTLGFGH